MPHIKLIHDITVSYVDHMGSDQRIVEAMLVSTKGLDAAEAASESIAGRINFLMRKRHGTPFECGALTVCVHAPIKVWREWHRHRVGWSFNEESGRYKQLEPVFYVPPPERPAIKAPGFKPSAPEFTQASSEQHDEIVGALRQSYAHAYGTYLHLLEMGVDNGLARDVLGVGIYSTCYCTCNPRSLMHALELRTKRPDARRPSNPLWEIANAAEQLEAIFARLWPVTHAAWNVHGRMAP